MDRISRRNLLGGAASVAAYAAMQSAEAQFNGCPAGFCPGDIAGGSGFLGGAAASFANGEAAPPGFHWDFVTDDLTGERITDDVTGTPVVDLVGN